MFVNRTDVTDVAVDIWRDQAFISFSLQQVSSSKHWRSSMIDLPVSNKIEVLYRYRLTFQMGLRNVLNYIGLSKQSRNVLELPCQKLQDRQHQWDTVVFGDVEIPVLYTCTVHCYLDYLLWRTERTALKMGMSELSYIMNEKFFDADFTSLAKISVNYINSPHVTGSQRLLLLYSIGLATTTRQMLLPDKKKGPRLKLENFCDLESYTSKDILSEAVPILKNLTVNFIREMRYRSDWIRLLPSFLVLDPELELEEVVSCKLIDQKLLKKICTVIATQLVPIVSSSQYRKLCTLVWKCTSSLSCLIESLSLASSVLGGHHFWNDDQHGGLKDVFKQLFEKVLDCFSSIQLFWKNSSKFAEANSWIVPLIHGRIFTLLQKGSTDSNECQALIFLLSLPKLFSVSDLSTGQNSVLRKILSCNDKLIQRTVFVEVMSRCCSAAQDDKVDTSVCVLSQEWIELSSNWSSDKDKLSSLLNASNLILEKPANATEFKKSVKSVTLEKAVQFKPLSFFKSAANGTLLNGKVEEMLIEAAKISIPDSLSVQQLQEISRPLLDVTSATVEFFSYNLTTRYMQHT